MEAAHGMSAERMADLERRVLALEARTRGHIWGGAQGSPGQDEDLVHRYGESVDKTTAARILGVTRVTVYAMLADGRVALAQDGRRVDVRSIAACLIRRSGRITRGRKKSNGGELQ